MIDFLMCPVVDCVRMQFLKLFHIEPEALQLIIWQRMRNLAGPGVSSFWTPCARGVPILGCCLLVAAFLTLEGVSIFRHLWRLGLELVHTVLVYCI